MLKHTLIKATEAGARELQRFFNTDFKITNKEGINNPVTEADHAAEKAIFAVIQNDYPNHFILSEEAGEIKMDSEYKWIIDPIDGTINFANGIPIDAFEQIAGVFFFIRRLILLTFRAFNPESD